MKTNTYLPLFSGFYNSIWDNEDNELMELEYINDVRKENGLDPIDIDELEFDYNTYELDICNQLTELVESKLKELNLVRSIEFENLHSPKYYNYSTDSINCIIDPIPEAIADYLQKYRENWTEYLREKYTSCDGFISHYDNFPDSEDWSLDNIINGEHQLGSFLQFTCENEDITEYDLYYDVEAYLTVKNFNSITI